MKIKSKLFIILSILSILFQGVSSNVYGKTIYGSLICHNKTYSDIEIYGSSEFNHCILSGKSNIFGTFIANDSSFDNQLKVYGTINITNSKFTDTLFSGTFTANNSHFQKLTVFGNATIQYSNTNDSTLIFSNLNAEESTFNKDLILFGINNYIKNSTIKGSIIIKSFIHFINTSQTLILDNTSVEGDVIFTNEMGIINLINNSEVFGNIIGIKPNKQ